MKIKIHFVQPLLVLFSLVIRSQATAKNFTTTHSILSDDRVGQKWLKMEIMIISWFNRKTKAFDDYFMEKFSI